MYILYIYIYISQCILVSLQALHTHARAYTYTYIYFLVDHPLHTDTYVHTLDFEGVFDAAGDKFARHTLPLNPRRRVIAN